MFFFYNIYIHPLKIGVGGGRQGREGGLEGGEIKESIIQILLYMEPHAAVN